MYFRVSRMVYCAGMGIRKPPVMRAVVRGSTVTPRMAAISETASVSRAGQTRAEAGWRLSPFSMASKQVRIRRPFSSSSRVST